MILPKNIWLAVSTTFLVGVYLFGYKSQNPFILNYSKTYCLFLLLWVCFSFLLFRFVAPRSALCFLIMQYLFLASSYYWTRTHPFDPYVQMPPARYQKAEKSPGEFRVLCLGGSVTAGVKLKPDDQYPRILESLLREKYPDVEINILNAGKPWYTSKHSLINYITYYQSWKPDLVIVMHAINDMYRSFSPSEFAVGEYDELWSHFYGASINGAKPPSFEKHFYINKIKPFVDLKLRGWIERDYPLSEFHSLPAYKRHMEALVRAIRSNSSSVMLVSEASLFKETMPETEKNTLYFGKRFCSKKTGFLRTEYPSHVSLLRVVRAYNSAARQTAKEQASFFSDADSVLPKTGEFFFDDCHLTAKGTRFLARYLAAEIQAASLIQNKPETQPA